MKQPVRVAPLVPLSLRASPLADGVGVEVACAAPQDARQFALGANEPVHARRRGPALVVADDSEDALAGLVWMLVAPHDRPHDVGGFCATIACLTGVSTSSLPHVADTKAHRLRRG
ncbi:MAG: hypothetical protein ACRDQ6_05530, partial [Pseudonocardiaceae bacterium]